MQFGLVPTPPATKKLLRRDQHNLNNLQIARITFSPFNSSQLLLKISVTLGPLGSLRGPTSRKRPFVLHAQAGRFDTSGSMTPLLVPEISPCDGFCDGRAGGEEF